MAVQPSGHEFIEKNMTWLIVLVILVVSVGGLVEIVPLFFQRSTTEPVQGLSRIQPLQLTGRDIYIREGCNNCHSQMIRPFRAETERYGHYSVAGEFVYDHPFLWGSKRTGPDLPRVGGRYSDEWHRLHLNQAARRRAGVEHAGLSVAREQRRGCGRHRGQDEGPAHGRRALHRRRDRQGAGGAAGQDRGGCADRLSARPGHRAERSEVEPWI